MKFRRFIAGASHLDQLETWFWNKGAFPPLALFIWTYSIWTQQSLRHGTKQPNQDRREEEEVILASFFWALERYNRPHSDWKIALICAARQHHLLHQVNPRLISRNANRDQHTWASNVRTWGKPCEGMSRIFILCASVVDGDSNLSNDNFCCHHTNE